MKVNGEHIQSIWYELETDEVCIIDQARLPYDFEILSLQSLTVLAVQSLRWKCEERHL